VGLFLPSPGSKLLALTDITGCPVQASAHRTLNSSKGVIKCANLKLCTKEEIIEELHTQGVVDSFKITVKSGENNRRPTNTFILTFNTPTAPPHINMDIFELRSTPTFQTPWDASTARNLDMARSSVDLRRSAVGVVANTQRKAAQML